MSHNRLIIFLYLVIFLFFQLILIPVSADVLNLPAPGARVNLSITKAPSHLKGLVINSQKPFELEFLIEKEHGRQTVDLQQDYQKLIKYFLSSMTIAEENQWVNLSPYEKERIVPDSFGKTEMGRDLLAQDYLLKQLTASLVHPESELGQKFWERVYELSINKSVPVNVFTKVWIVPDKAQVYEDSKTGTAYIVESSLKVLTELDYLSSAKHEVTGPAVAAPVTINLIKEIVIPELTKEVNEGANFAPLRQMYSAMILAAWYKRALKQSILTKVYANNNKIIGTEFSDALDVKQIYAHYLEAFKKGAVNLIREEQDPQTQRLMPRKYFAGGFENNLQEQLTISRAMTATQRNQAMASIQKGIVRVLVALTTASPVLANEPVKNLTLTPDEQSLRVDYSFNDNLKMFAKLGDSSIGSFAAFGLEGYMLNNSLLLGELGLTVADFNRDGVRRLVNVHATATTKQSLSLANITVRPLVVAQANGYLASKNNNTFSALIGAGINTSIKYKDITFDIAGLKLAKTIAQTYFMIDTSQEIIYRGPLTYRLKPDGHVWNFSISSSGWEAFANKESGLAGNQSAGFLVRNVFNVRGLTLSWSFERNLKQQLTLGIPLALDVQLNLGPSKKGNTKVGSPRSFDISFNKAGELLLALLKKYEGISLEQIGDFGRDLEVKLSKIDAGGRLFIAGSNEKDVFLLAEVTEKNSKRTHWYALPINKPVQLNQLSINADSLADVLGMVAQGKSVNFLVAEIDLGGARNFVLREGNGYVVEKGLLRINAQAQAFASKELRTMIELAGINSVGGRVRGLIKRAEDKEPAGNDQAMATEENRGGIDFNSKHLKLVTNVSKYKSSLTFSKEALQEFDKIQGLTGKILSISPVTSLLFPVE